MIDTIIALGWLALIMLVLGVLAYAILALAPKVVAFVKAFIKWHSYDDDDEWYL